MQWTPPEKPSELTENRLIKAILDGTFPAGSNLPGERDLAAQLGVTRPTLRTVLQRLARDGWIEIRQGKPTRVTNYWEEGTLAILVAAAMHETNIPPDFVPNLLSVRILLAPAYGRLAVERDPQAVAAAIQGYQALNDSADNFAMFDWQLHRKLTILSGNPVYTLFINSVRALYAVLGKAYYSFSETRMHSMKFYQELLICAERGDGRAAEALIDRVMKESSDLWQKYLPEKRSITR